MAKVLLLMVAWKLAIGRGTERYEHGRLGEIGKARGERCSCRCAGGEDSRTIGARLDEDGDGNDRLTTAVIDTWPQCKSSVKIFQLSFSH